MLKLLRTFLKKNKLLLLIFLLSTSFFLYQRIFGGVHWDFALYASNARYMFSDGFYFDWWVPPLTPFLLGVFSILTLSLAEYAYIIFVSALFLFSCLKFSETFKIDKLFFYAAFVNYYVLYYGLRNGTELISLSLTMLFFAYIFMKDEKRSSFFISLSFLARYSNIFLLPFILLNRNLKKIALSALIFLMVLSPWLLFNYLQTGNPFTSIGDYYVLVKLQSSYYSNESLQSIGMIIIIASISFFAIFRNRLRKIINLKDFSMILLLLLVIITFLNTPFRNARYLFLLTLPLVYLFVKIVPKHKKVLYAILAFNLITTIFIIPDFSYNEDAQFYVDIKEECTMMSNAWVYFDYHGIPTEPYPFREFVNDSINQGYRIILYKWITEPDYNKNETFLAQFPMIENNTNYVILGNREICKEYYTLSNTFKDRKNEYLLKAHNRTIQEELGCYENDVSKALCYILGI